MPVWDDFRAEFSPRFPCLARKIPYSTEQGKLRADQGIAEAQLRTEVSNNSGARETRQPRRRLRPIPIQKLFSMRA
jgi:hypothetical protein